MIPTGVQADIYRSPSKVHESRVAVTLGPRMWESPFEELFDAPLTPADWWYTQYGGLSPLVNAGNLEPRTYGGPPREQVVGRKHLFPETNLGSLTTIRATFPEIDPIYPYVISVIGLTQLLGIEHDPLRVIFQGSANTLSGAGKIWVGGAGASYIEYANDGAEHEYSVAWAPNAPGGAGNEKLTVRRDGAIIAEVSHPYFAVQPRGVALGLIQTTRTDSTTGTPGVPTTIGLVGSVRVEENGDGYETFVPPSWTTPDTGKDIDTAPDGEIFTQDGVPWVILPRDVVTWSAEGGKQALADGATINLDAADPLDPGGTPNRFLGMRWEGRAITIDAREGREVTTLAPPLPAVMTVEYAPWLRQFAGIIRPPIKTAGERITFSAQDRPMARLNTYISRAYTALNGQGGGTTGQQGYIEGVNVGFLLTEVFKDLFDVSDTVAGGSLGDVETEIFAPDVLPLSMSSGAQSLQAVVAEWCDRLACTIYRRYSTQGVARYGRVHIHLWDFGTGLAGWVLNGRASTRGPEDVLSVELVEGAGIGQANYRQQTPVYGPENLSLQFLPVVGTFPIASLPVNERDVSDSAAYLASSSLSVLLNFFDKNNVIKQGGLAKFRYMLENALRRQATVVISGGSYVEPGDEYGIEDPVWTGLTSAESFMVLDWKKSYSADGGLETSFTAHTTDWVNAIIRAL